MLNAIIRLALQNRLLVVALCLATLIYGGLLTSSMPIDVFPDLDRPRVVVMTECLGLATEDVERDVTVHLDSVLLGATGVQMVRSQSTTGLSVVIAEFDWETPIYAARQVVQERLASATTLLPPDRPDIRPQMAPIGSMMGQIMLIGMSRKSGPRGGVLASVGNTPYLAELVFDSAARSVTVHLWNPRDEGQRRLEDPAAWRPLSAESSSLTLHDAELPEGTMHLSAQGDGTAVFTCQDPGLKDFSADRPRFTRVVLGSRTHKVEFAPLERRLMDLRTTADWVVRPRLLKIPGIAQVVIMGGGRMQYQVLVDAARLQQFDVTLEDVEKALRKNNVNTSGGYAERGSQEQPIRFLARVGPQPDKVLRDIRQIPVKQATDRTILIEHVAEVTTGPQPKRGDAAINGQFGVLLTVARQPHLDTRALTDQILVALKEIEATLPADVDINPDFFQMKRFIDRGIYNVAEALAIGAVLVLIILFLFLLNFRTTFISLMAIPVSLALTAIVFRAVGWLTGTQPSINVMTLGGIAVALGELVDDAIVDVENIFRRLRENNNSPHPRSALAVIYEASVEIRSAIVFGTFMVILVFVPLFALSGMEGRLFAPLGLAYIVSILASLLVSLTLTPVLSYYLLRRAPAVHRREDSPLLKALKWGASHLIRFSMARPAWILLLSWLLVAIAVWQFTALGTDFLPDFDEGTVQVNVDLPSGASLQASNKISAQVEARLARMLKTRSNPGGDILGILRRTGRSELEEHADPVTNNEFFLSINPASDRTREELIKDILDDLRDAVPGVAIEVEQPLKHLMSEMLAGSTAQIAIKVIGDDLTTLKNIGEQVKVAINSVAGISPPIVEAQDYVAELHIRPRREDLAFYGVDAEHLATFVNTALSGQVVSHVVDGQRRFDLVLRLAEQQRTDYTNLDRLLLDLPHASASESKGSVPLSALVDVDRQGKGPNQIKRENGRRRLIVRCNALGRDLGSVVADIHERVERVSLPAGYFIELGGQFENQRRATLTITLLSGIALVGMFFILYMLYPSARIVLQVLNALPMAFIGGVLALLVTGQSLTVAALVGFISLGGIAARNGILLVTHYFHLMKHEGEAFTPAMIQRGSLERLAPVLMTALTAGIALIPLVVGGQQPGREILYPVATVILGGLITSTLCEFLIHPGLFWRFSGQDAVRISQTEEESWHRAASSA
jgi:HME family heavy-metal exporter